MDTLSHGLWGAAALYPKFKNNKQSLWAGFIFGMLPDLLAFAPLFIAAIFGAVQFGGPEAWDQNSTLYRYAVESYNYTHSLVIFLAVFVAVWVLRRKAFWPLIPWGLHILMDIPTHPDFFNTPFLFPLLDFKLTWGLSWGHPAIFFPNWALLIVIYFFIFRSIRRRKKLAHENS